MTTLLTLISMTAAALLGAIACAIVLSRSADGHAGRRASIAGAAYPVGALAVAAWMHLVALSGVRASWLVAIGPVVAAIGVAAWLTRRHVATIRWHDAGSAILGRSLEAPLRRLWIAILAWLTLRFVVLGIEVVSRPPLPWEAWLHALSRARVWYADGIPGRFVAEPVWWQSGGYLAGLAAASPWTPALDAWTAIAIGRFDDTSLHLPWLAFLASQALLAYGALRMLGAMPLASLGAAAIAATLPLSNAHAALGGTGALWLSTCYLGAFSFAWRASRERSPGAAMLAAVLAAGMVAAGGGAGVLFAVTLVPFALATLSAAAMRKVFAALVVAAVLGVIVAARNALFVPPAMRDVPLPGMQALAQHALFLGNWHLVAHAAIAVTVLASRDWREPSRLPATTSVALGIIALVAVATSPAGRALFGSTGSIGHAGTVLAPVLAVWTAAIAHAWWTRTNGVAAVAPAIADAPMTVSDAPGERA